jgi:hypothetical protein
MATGGKKKLKVKKRCCVSKRMCAGCPLRPENQRKRRRPN